MIDIIIRLLLLIGCIIGFGIFSLMIYYNTRSYFIDRYNDKEWRK